MAHAPSAVAPPREPSVAVMAGIAIALSFLAYLPSLSNGFVSMDDHGYFYQNPNLARPLWDFVAWAFTDVRQVNLWLPLTWLSLGADQALFGPGPFGHHLVNALLHAANAGLVAALCVELLDRASPAPRLGASRAAAALVAALLFSLHPLRVESVSWASERKDVLSAFFALLATLAYLRHASRGGWRWLLVATGLLALSLLAKPVTVVVPLAWILLDAWPLRRGVRPATLLEKVPPLLCSLAAAVVTLLAARAAILDFSGAPIVSRLVVALGAPVRYLALTALPVGLHPFRPYPAAAELLTAGRLLAAAGTVALSALLFARARRWPGPAAAWAAFLVLLLPNLGILQSGNQELADRFTYLPAIALSLAVAGLLERRLLAPGPRWWGALAAAALCALTAATVAQQRHWKDSVHLWRRNVELEPQSGISWSDLSWACLDAGDVECAIGAKTRSVDIAERKRFPGVEALYGELSHMLLRASQRPQAVDSIERGLGASRNPRFPRMAAETCRQLGMPAEAERFEAMAVELESRGLPSAAGGAPAVR